MSDTSGIQDLISKRGQVLDKLHERTFTRWLNWKLSQEGGPAIDNLYSAFTDGVLLVRLVEMMSGRQAPKYHSNIGNKSFLGLENINIALKMMQEDGIAPLISAREIQEGNMKAVQSVMWWLIYHYQVLRPFMEGGPLYDSLDKEALDASKERTGGRLLSWLKMNTKGYPNTNIRDLHSSWFDGMGLLALIHQYDPSLLIDHQGNNIRDFEELDPTMRKENLANALDLAEKNLGIPKLFEADEVLSTTASEVPSEECFIAYLSTFPLVMTGIQPQGKKEAPSATTTTPQQQPQQQEAGGEQVLPQEERKLPIEEEPIEGKPAREPPEEGRITAISGEPKAEKETPLQQQEGIPPAPPLPGDFGMEKPYGYPSVVPTTPSEEAAEAKRQAEARQLRGESPTVGQPEKLQGKEAGEGKGEGDVAKGGVIAGGPAVAGGTKPRQRPLRKKKPLPKKATQATGVEGKEAPEGAKKRKVTKKRPAKKPAGEGGVVPPTTTAAIPTTTQADKPGLKGKKLEQQQQQEPQQQVAEGGAATTPAGLEGKEGEEVGEVVIGEAVVFEIERIPSLQEYHQRKNEEKRERKRKRKLEKEVMERKDIVAPEDKLREGGEEEAPEEGKEGDLQRIEEAVRRDRDAKERLERETQRLRMEALRAEEENRALAAQIMGLKGETPTSGVAAPLPSSLMRDVKSLQEANAAVEAELAKIAALRGYLRELNAQGGMAVPQQQLQQQQKQQQQQLRESERVASDLQGALRAKKRAKEERRNARRDAALAERDRICAEEKRILAEREKVQAEMERIKAEEQKALQRQQQDVTGARGPFPTTTTTTPTTTATTTPSARYHHTGITIIPVSCTTAAPIAATTPTITPTTTTAPSRPEKGKEKLVEKRWVEVGRHPAETFESSSELRIFPVSYGVLTPIEPIKAATAQEDKERKMGLSAEREARKAQGIRDQPQLGSVY